MFTSASWIEHLKSAFRRRPAGGPGNRGAARRARRVPYLEHLEERRVLSGYTITNIGSLGGTFGFTLDINASGSIVGRSAIAQNLAQHAYVYSHGTLIDLGTLGGLNSSAGGINDHGEIVGISMIAPNSAQNDLFLVRRGHMTDLGPAGPARTSGPLGDFKISNRGDIIGFTLGNGNAALDRRGRLIDLGSLAGQGSAARALNDKGQVVGFSPVSGPGPNVFHAFLYMRGRMTDLGTLGGDDSVANDINQHGEVVGPANIANGYAHAFLYKNGRMKDLGTLGGPASDAGAINNHGDVVGVSTINSTTSHGYLYRNGKMIDLNSLIPANSGFVVVNAEDINDRGQIAAEAISTNPQDHSYYIVKLNPTKSAR
jgi:probable HAF family extracellular repeat protein